MPLGRLDLNETVRLNQERNVEIVLRSQEGAESRLFCMRYYTNCVSRAPQRVGNHGPTSAQVGVQRSASQSP